MTHMTTLKIVLAMLLWALCFPLITAGLEFSPHLTFATLRAMLAGTVLTLLACLLRRPFPCSRQVWVALIIVGLGATSLGFVGMFHAAEFVTPGLATVIANTQPLLAAVLATFWLGERLSHSGKIGLAAAFAGILLIALPRVLSDGDGNYAIGVGYLILAAIGVTFSNVAIKTVAKDVDALFAMGLQMLIGSVPLAVAALVLEEPTDINWTPVFVGSLLGLVFFGSALVYWLWFSALETVSLNRANAFSFLVPVFGLTISAIFYGETLSRLQLVGIAMIFIGIIFVNRKNYCETSKV